jgi:hypothetical protein
MSKKLKEITFYFELRTHGFTFKMLLLQRKKGKRTQTKQFDKKGTKKSMFPKHLIIVLTSQHNIQLRLPKRGTIYGHRALPTCHMLGSGKIALCLG